jgi:hypothetical protein
MFGIGLAGELDGRNSSMDALSLPDTLYLHWYCGFVRGG